MQPIKWKEKNWITQPPKEIILLSKRKSADILGTMAEEMDVQEGKETEKPVYRVVELGVHQDSENDEPIARDNEGIHDKESQEE